MRYTSQRIQTERGMRFGLWGVWDYDNNNYVALGPKGDINKLAKLMNEYGNLKILPVKNN